MTNATAGVRDIFERFFADKSAHRVTETHDFFHPSKVYYADATLGWQFPSNEALLAVWKEFMPKWPVEAVSYPTRIIGDTTGAVVIMTDTPELFGGEIRAVAAIDLEDGRIVRWIDYWDGRNFSAAKAREMGTPAGQFPDLYTTLPARKPGRLDDVVSAFTTAKPDEAAALFSADGVIEDLTLRTAIHGRAAIARYLGRAAGSLPYTDGTQVRHIVGSDLGGGYEWQTGGAVPRGITAVELSEVGSIDRMTAVWDGSLLDDDAVIALTTLAVERQF